uniref:Cyclin A1 n=1 Tax=Astyanax mexicanus TaxID=7994 RepID=A0A3B1JQC5_ASTMX
MSSSALAPFASRSSRENISAQARMDGPRLKAGQRVVLGVLTENDHHNRTCNQVSLCLSPIMPFMLNSKIQGFKVFFFLLFVSGVCMCTGSCLDASMQSLEEEEVAVTEDVLCVPEYAEDIHRHLRESEIRYRPKPGYMRKQPDITNCMRVILIDWLVEVAEEYKLCSETVYLAVNYLDRFLSSMSVLRGKLQLVGTAAILVAAKYEEIYPPEVDEFVYITDDTYSKKQLLRMEHLILKVLSFDMTAPTSYQFLTQYVLVERVCSETANLALYLSELTLLEVEPFLQHLPSKIAAAAYCLANYTLNRTLWPDALHAFTGYSLAEIAQCLIALHKLHLSAESRPQQAIREKYKSSEYSSVSLIKPVEGLPLH